MDATLVLFRISIAIVVAGSSCLAFVLAGLARERSEMMFRLLNHMGAGISLGMALISLPLEASIAFGATNDAVFNGFVTALIFVSMIVAENIAAVGGVGELCMSSYSYRPVSISEDEDDEGESMLTAEGNANSAQDDYDDLPAVDDDFDEEEGNHSSIELATNRVPSSSRGVANQHTSVDFQKRRFFPSSILLFVSLYEASTGAQIAAAEHSGVGGYIQMVAHAVLLSFTFGLMLEFLLAPKRYKLMFMFMFSCSAAVGIVICGTGLVATDQYSSITHLRGYASVVVAGVFLYLATVHIMPAEMSFESGATKVATPTNNRLAPSYSSNSNSFFLTGHNSQSVADKMTYLGLKISALFVGFALTALPSVMFALNVEGEWKRALPPSPTS